MSLKAQLDQDLKTALLAGDKTLVTTLRGLRSAVLYAEVAENKRDQGLNDQEILAVLRKEAKKRKESADLYVQGGNQDKADAELAELRTIEKYLPQPLSDEQLKNFVEQAIAEIGVPTPQTMGRVIGRVKELAEGGADGGRIAQAVKERVQT